MYGWRATKRVDQKAVITTNNNQKKFGTVRRFYMMSIRGVTAARPLCAPSNPSQMHSSKHLRRLHTSGGVNALLLLYSSFSRLPITIPPTIFLDGKRLLSPSFTVPSLSSLRPPTIRLAIGTPTERAAHGIGKHPTGPTDGRDEAVYNVEIRNENSATRFANAVTRRSGRHKRKEAKTNLWKNSAAILAIHFYAFISIVHRVFRDGHAYRFDSERIEFSKIGSADHSYSSRLAIHGRKIPAVRKKKINK